MEEVVPKMARQKARMLKCLIKITKMWLYELYLDGYRKNHHSSFAAYNCYHVLASLIDPRYNKKSLWSLV